jgi:hypothetical protein
MRTISVTPNFPSLVLMKIPFVSPTIMLEPLALDGVQQYVDMASFAEVFLPSACRGE